MDTVILAGGAELSPSPYNSVFPKPMLPLGQKPVLELLIDHLRRQGLEHFFVVLNPVGGKILETYFGNGAEWGVSLQYIWEKKPRGTAGALKLLEHYNLSSPFLVINGDIITTWKIAPFVEFHKSRKSYLTVGCIERGFYLDFGYLVLSENQVQDYREKPTISLTLSSGIYLMEKEVFPHIPQEEVFHIPHLVETLTKKGLPVYGFCDSQSFWWDIGDRREYERISHNPEEILQKLEG